MIKFSKQSMRLLIEALTLYSFEMDNNRRLLLGHNRVNKKIKQAQLIKRILQGELIK